MEVGFNTMNIVDTICLGCLDTLYYNHGMYGGSWHNASLYILLLWKKKNAHYLLLIGVACVRLITSIIFPVKQTTILTYNFYLIRKRNLHSNLQFTLITNIAEVILTHVNKTHIQLQVLKLQPTKHIYRAQMSGQAPIFNYRAGVGPKLNSRYKIINTKMKWIFVN